MSYKLIFRNLKRNIKDYAIYFLTMVLTIGIFYAFNAVYESDSLKSMGEVSALMEVLMSSSQAISIVIAITLGFLILYVNHFLLKRRKKELGLYMLLGMDKRKISGIFVGETIVIGVISFIAGILFGTVISQFLVVLALRLFGGQLSAFHLSFSEHALGVTFICFVIIYLVTAIFNVAVVSKVKLVELLMAERKNEEFKDQKISVYLIVFLIGVLSFLAAAVCFYTKDLLPKSQEAVKGSLFMVIATICIFFATASAAMQLLKKKKSLYYKNINSFLIRQIGSKIQSNFISMSMVCLLLTVTLLALTAGTSMAFTMERMTSEFAPYEFVLMYNPELGDQSKTVDVIEKAKTYQDPVDLTTMIEASYQFEEKDADITYQQIFEGQQIELSHHDEQIKLLEKKVSMIGISDFNALLRLQGKEELVLPQNSCFVNCNYKGTIDYIDTFLKEHDSVTIYGTTLTIADKKHLKYIYEETAIGNNDRGTFIVPDEVAEKAKADAYVLQGYWKEGITGEQGNQALNTLVINDMRNSPFAWNTHVRMETMLYALEGMPVFLCTYVGLVFLLICVALISVQQLTETEDNKKRYVVLKKQGVSDKMMRSTIKKQIGVHFLSPLIIAGVYTLLAMPFIIQRISAFLNMEVGANMIVTLLALIVIYGGYYFVTVRACERMLFGKRKTK